MITGACPSTLMKTDRELQWLHAVSKIGQTEIRAFTITKPINRSCATPQSANACRLTAAARDKMPTLGLSSVTMTIKTNNGRLVSSKTSDIGFNILALLIRKTKFQPKFIR